MPVATVGPVTLRDVQMESWLLKFDKEGQCTSALTREALVERLAQAGDTPVIVFSHGWNNDFDDATELYRNFLLRLQEHIVANNPGMVRPIFIGVLWPSIWLSFDPGLYIAGAAAFSDSERRVAAELATDLPEGPERQRFDALMSKPGLDAAGVADLSVLLQRALARSAPGVPALAEEGGAPSAHDIAAALRAQPEPSAYAQADEDDLAPGGTIGAVRGAQPRPAGLVDYLDPRKALRVASVYKMKDRAGVVGSRGVAELLSDILARAAGSVHLVGHSYGCKVVMSALAAASAPRKVTSALLLQPAISHLAFAAAVPATGAPGGYAASVAKIDKSLVITYSASDAALHDLFHLALRREADLGELRIAGAGAGEPPSPYAALGGYGPRLSGERLAGRLPEPGVPYDLPRTPVPLAFDGSAGQVRDHGDVTTPYTAWLLYLQLRR